MSEATDSVIASFVSLIGSWLASGVFSTAVMADERARATPFGLAREGKTFFIMRIH
jgi:hypothetical protein